MIRALLITTALLLAARPVAADEPLPLSKQTTSGPVTATVTLTPNAPSIGDPLTLTLRVVAAPMVEALLPEFGEALDRFPVRDFVPTSSTLR